MVDIIMKVVDGLNTNSGSIIAIATVVLVGVTIFYAWVTRQMRLDTQKSRIVIYLGLEKEQRKETVRVKIPAMYLYVENIGMGLAYDVEFDTNLDFVIPDKRSLREIEFIAHGIRYLPPKQKRKLHLGDRWTEGKTMNELMQDKPLEFTVTYKDISHKECQEEFCLNFGEYESEYRQMVAEKM